MMDNILKPNDPQQGIPPVNPAPQIAPVPPVIVATPQNVVSGFEKTKYYIDLAKWFISSVAFVLITTIIDAGFKDRAESLLEMQQYDKYVTELVVLNKDPANKWKLAQFFSNVTPSVRLKNGWEAYYKAVDVEYRKFIAPYKAADSTLRVEQSKLIAQPILDKKDSARFMVVTSKLEQTQAIINPDIILPNATSTPEADWEVKGFGFLLNYNVEDAINAFNSSENAKPSYHMVYDIYKYLHSNEKELKDAKSPAWKSAYQWILKNASWKMPDDVKLEMQKRVS